METDESTLYFQMLLNRSRSVGVFAQQGRRDYFIIVMRCGEVI